MDVSLHFLIIYEVLVRLTFTLIICVNMLKALNYVLYLSGHPPDLKVFWTEIRKRTQDHKEGERSIEIFIVKIYFF